MIYLDYNATTPLRKEARAAMLPYLGDAYGNPSSAHRLGSAARVAVETARAEVAALIGALPGEVVFTSGGTEANNLALFGVASARPGAIVTTAIEHSSVLEPAAVLERDGRPVVRLGVDSAGRVDLGDVRAALGQRPACVSIGWANNEIGTVQPIGEIAGLCRRAGVPLHVDAVQALGKIPVDTAPDLMSLSAHKVGGPKGVGALFVRTGTPLRALHHGGGQERGARAGTENVAGIAGFGAACRGLAADAPDNCAKIVELRERLWRGLAARVGGIERNSPPDGCLPNTLNVRIGNVRGEAIVAALDLEGIAVSTGSACAAGAAEPSHVLRALGLDDEQARDGIRFSLGYETAADEIDQVIDALVSCVRRMQSVARNRVAHG